MSNISYAMTTFGPVNGCYAEIYPLEESDGPGSQSFLGATLYDRGGQIYDRLNFVGTVPEFEDELQRVIEEELYDGG